MAEDLFCPIHGEVQSRIAEIEKKQNARKCQTNESDINHLKSAISDIKATDEKQWTSIDHLKRMVYMGAGATAVLAFLGSIVGALLKR